MPIPNTLTKHGSVIVTGGSRGIGAAVSRLLGAHGYSVAVNFIKDESAAAAVVRDIVSAGGRAIAVQGNVGREEDILRLFKTAERELGSIEGLVNNAGVTGGFARVQDVTASALADVLTINVAGAMLCAREAVRRMSTASGGTGGSS
jgi:NAD(P)-dependent dehydrogenase (short-subunit alcohol dehydrogenase family)